MSLHVHEGYHIIELPQTFPTGDCNQCGCKFHYDTRIVHTVKRNWTPMGRSAASYDINVIPCPFEQCDGYHIPDQ